MRIGLLDLEREAGGKFPNLALMKISAWHKAYGDTVEWYDPLAPEYDIVYESKVFSWTPDYEYPINARLLLNGGTGFCIEVIDGREEWRGIDAPLDDEIEHIYPDYALYGLEDTAMGYLTRGCPRGCDFCIVKHKEGRISRKVADLSEFWHGEKNIELLDPNMFACREWRGLADQLVASGAWINFSQGVDVRIMTEEMAEAIKRMKVKRIHFAWDRYEERDIVLPKLKMFMDITGLKLPKVICYVLTNYDTTPEQDLERVMALREIGVNPDVRIYQKRTAPRITRQLARWVNNRRLWGTFCTFNEYLEAHI